MACPPLRGAEGRGHPQGPASASTTHFLSVLFFFLLQALQKWQLSFSVSLYLLSRICPGCACTQLFLVPYRFLVFCCLEEVCPGASKH